MKCFCFHYSLLLCILQLSYHVCSLALQSSLCKCKLLLSFLVYALHLFMMKRNTIFALSSCSCIASLWYCHSTSYLSSQIHQSRIQFFLLLVSSSGSQIPLKEERCAMEMVSVILEVSLLIALFIVQCQVWAIMQCCC